MKKSILFFLLICLFCVGCHNNAHIRTQKILEQDETALSVSGTANIIGGWTPGGIRTLASTNVFGLRSEASYLKGTGKSDFGPYLGIGADYAGGGGIILGYDYRKYLNLDKARPIKAGGQIEINFSPLGQTLHIRPTLTTATNNKKPDYYGVHGILASGNLEDHVFWDEIDENYDAYEYYYNTYNEIDSIVSYDFYSQGLGITLGTQFAKFKNIEIQLQLDFSLIQNSFKTDFSFPNNVYSNWGTTADREKYLNYTEIYPLFSASIGTSLLKPRATKRKPLEPLPSPMHQESIIAQNVYDPETGEILKTDPVQYDPETGEILKRGAVQFDPETGKTLKTSTIQYDPEIDALPKKNTIEYDSEIKTQFTDTTKKIDTELFFPEEDIIKRAIKDANNQHKSLLWGAFGATALPAGIFGSIMGVVTMEVLNNDFAFAGFIGGGLFGLIVPTNLAKLSSNFANVNYPHSPMENHKKKLYKSTYQKEVKRLRAKSTTRGTVGSLGLCGLFLFSLILAV